MALLQLADLGQADQVGEVGEGGIPGGGVGARSIDRRLEPVVGGVGSDDGPFSRPLRLFVAVTVG
jgi:hypothetical protein